jgi:hypothetical protein
VHELREHEWVLVGLVRMTTTAAQADPKKGKARFVVCVRNTGYPASLELRKLYRLLNADQASRLGQMRVVDESGEDYLYPEKYFVPIKLPQSAREGCAAGNLSGRRRCPCSGFVDALMGSS